MPKLDYLIIGQGVAGSCLGLKLINENKSFTIIDHPQDKASTIAAGVYNPVVLYRFALIWQAEIQMKLMRKYFQEFEFLLNDKFNFELPTYRILKDENEIHAWQKKATQPELTPYINDEVFTSKFSEIHAPFGFTEVKNTGRIDLENCLNSFQSYLNKHQLYQQEIFDFSSLEVHSDKIFYKNFEAKNIVFCDGFGIKNNPYFNYLPIIGVKGEVLKIKTKHPVPPAIWKGNQFLMPIENYICYAGSNYNREDLSYEPTEQGKNEIINGIKEFYHGDFEIISHQAAVRPTVIDRRPVIGRHPIQKNMFLLNGMGTRGTLLAPAMTEEIYNFIENQKPISPEADLNRFTKKYFNK